MTIQVMQKIMENQVNKHNILLKKLNSTHGFSLTETLSTLVIMSLVGIMVTSGIISSVRVYRQITEYNNAQLMLSNTITALHDELIYALPDSLSGASDENSKELSFNHVKNGAETIKFQSAESSGKGIYIKYGEESDKFYPMVSYQSSTSLYNDWTVSDEGDGVLSVDVSVCKADGTELIKVEDYEIKLLNG